MAEENDSKKKVWIAGGILLLIVSAYVVYLILSTDRDPPQPVRDSGFRECLGFDESWEVLYRPSSLWKPGLAIEFQDGAPAAFHGNFLTNCLAGLDVQVAVGAAAPVTCETSVDIDASFLASVGLTDDKLVEARLQTASGGPNVIARVQIDKARETYLDMLQIENYLTRERFDAMGTGCKRTLTDENRFIVAGTYKIEKGLIEVVRNDGASIDLSLPEYSVLKTAVGGSGFTVTSSGKIEISESAPVVIAVRKGDFGDILEDLGITRRGAEDFAAYMRAAGLSKER